MAKYYSKTTNGFYPEDYTGILPDDVVSISDDEWQSLLTGQSFGHIIQAKEDGYPESVPLTRTSLELATARITGEILRRLDAGVKEWGYTNMLSALSYITSTVTAWAEEAVLFQAWRDAVWNWAIPKMNALVEGEPLDIDAFMADMPAAPKRPKKKK